MGIEEEDEAEEELTILVQLGYMPAVAHKRGDQVPEQDIVREMERAKKRAARLSRLPQLEGRVEFSVIEATGGKSAGTMIVAGSESQPYFEEADFELALSKSPGLGHYLSETPQNELALLLTNGKLVDDSLAIIVGRAVLMNELALAALTTRLLRDPWPALALLFLIEIQESLFGVRETAQQVQKARNLEPLTTFQRRWSVEAAAEWITGPSGRDSITAYEHLFGSDGVESFHKLLDDLPLPGGLDDADVRATTYSDTEARRDLLGFTSYVEAFKRIILHRETTTPLAIAVIGEWGKGKSSFMRFLRRELEAHDLRNFEPAESEKQPPLVPRAVTVWFDAWQYDSEEKVLAALLQTVAQEIQAHFTPYSWLKYRLALGVKQVFTSWRVAYQLMLHAFVVPVVLMLATVTVLALGPELAKGSLDFTKALLGAMARWDVWGSGGVLGVLYVGWRILRRLPLPLGLDLNKLYEEEDQSARLGFLSVFKEEFSRRIEQMAVMPAWSLRALPEENGTFGSTARRRVLEPILLSFKDFANDLRKIGRTIWWFPGRDRGVQEGSGGNRVVVFIDDLDRCRADKIVDILEAIKVSLDTPGIVFVLGMDDKYVKTGIYLRYKEHIETREMLYSPEAEAPGAEEEIAKTLSTEQRRADWWPNRYLEKVIQIPFRLPDATDDKLRNLVGELLGVEKKEAGVPISHPEEPGEKGPGPSGERRLELDQERIYHEQMLREVDTAEINQMILQAAAEMGPVHRHNPRRVKAFVNRCRLGLYLLKLDLPDLIEADYLQAIALFKKWEQRLARPREDGDDALPADHSLWYRRLRSVRQCLFAVPE